MSYPPPMNPVQPGTPATPKKSNAGGIIIGIIVGVLVLCVAAGGVAFFAFNRLADKAEQSLQDFEDSLASAAADPGPKTATGSKHTVRYEIDGSGDNVLVNWALGVGGQDNETTSLPWSTELTFEREAAGLQVFAIVTGAGNVDGCRILVDGKELVKGESQKSGKYTICTVVFQE